MTSRSVFSVRIVRSSCSSQDISSALDALERNATTNLSSVVHDRQSSPKIVEVKQHRRPANGECEIKSTEKDTGNEMRTGGGIICCIITGTCAVFSPSLSLVYSIMERFDTRISHDAEWSQSSGMLQSKPNVASMYDLSSLGGLSNGTSGMNLFYHRIEYFAIIPFHS